MTITIKDIVFNAAMFLGLEDVCTLIESRQLTADGKKVTASNSVAEVNEINQLIRCANLVIGEVAAEYLPLFFTQKIDAADGEFAYSRFAKNVLDIKSVKNDGVSVRFKQLFDRIVLPAGSYEAEYSYLPESAGFFENIDYTDGRVSARVLGYGTACEYSVISGNQEDALVWDKRYRDALTAGFERREKTVKKRRWF